MYYVYILRSLKFENKIYIGYTSNLKKRLKEHNSGTNYTTRRILPVELLYYEAFRSKIDAQNRERKLKHYGNSLDHLKRRMFNSLHPESR